MHPRGDDGVPGSLPATSGDLKKMKSSMDDQMVAGPLQDFGRLTPLTDALAAALAVIEPVAPSRHPLRGALGRIAAESILASNAYPPTYIAARDGYMAISHETIGATPYAPAYVTGDLPTVRAGEAMAEGRDAVLPPDAVVFGSSGVEVLQSVFPGSGVRYSGEDLAIGSVMVEAGDQLRADSLALLGLTGIESLLLKIPHLSVEGSGPLSSMVVDLASSVGASVGDFAEADATVCLCGPGYAASATAVQRFSAQGRLIAHGLAIHPGAATALCMVPRRDGRVRLVFIVPDRLEEVLAAWLLIIRPCLACLAGTKAVENSDILPLSSKIVSTPGFSDLVLMRRTAAVEPFWEPIATGNVPWSAFPMADAYCLLAAEQEGFPAGTLVRGYRL